MPSPPWNTEIRTRGPAVKGSRHRSIAGSQASARWPRLALEQVKAARARRRAWRRLFPPGQERQLESLSIEERADARRAADLVADSHRVYFSAFNSLTAEAQESFEKRAWIQATLNAERRVRLYRTAVDDTWQKMQRLFPERLPDRQFWMAARRAFLERIFNDYEADLALTFFYSIMRLAFDHKDKPVEYADDGLAEHSHIWNPHRHLGNLRSQSETDEQRGDPHPSELRIPRALRKPGAGCRPGDGASAGRLAEADLGRHTPDICGCCGRYSIATGRRTLWGN